MSSSYRPNVDLGDIDVFIAGSGPIGATYARKLVDAGLRVVMAEIGAQDTKVPGQHKKNELRYQKDIDSFVNVIKGDLSKVSIPVNSTVVPTLDPDSWQNPTEKPFVRNGQNPDQSPFDNLGGQAVTRCVGGMSTHWTCATPRFHPELERPRLDVDDKRNDEEWNKLYTEAEKLIGTSEKEFDESIRHTLVLKTLQETYPNRTFKPLPLAAKRLTEQYVEWKAADTVFGNLINPQHCPKDNQGRPLFTLLADARCTKLCLKEGSKSEVNYALLRDLTVKADAPKTEKDLKLHAKVFIVAAGAVCTPQILVNSGFNGYSDDERRNSLIPNLGKWITEQTLAFCQVVLRRELVDRVESNYWNIDWWGKAVAEHHASHPEDPLPLPFQDPEPQVTTPVSKEFPWHTQIHRDAFSYGGVAETIDPRIIVDLRWFGMVEPHKENRLEFSQKYSDAFGMPQATFHFRPDDDSRKRSHKMMHDMCAVAEHIGGYLPDSQPQFMEPGLALHLGGTYRAGTDPKESVVNNESQVWNFDNLFLGGVGVIPTAFAANPTLTAMAYAIRAVPTVVKVAQNVKA